MESTKINGLTFLKRILTLGLCLAMLIGSAIAENVNVKQFYSGDQDNLFFLRTLSDGRLLFGGSKCLDENKDIDRKWLLCLNPDRTVSWEYITPEEEASTVLLASERPDGTLAVVFDMGDEDYEAPEGARSKIRYFTMDGQPTGKEVNLPGAVQIKEDADDSYIKLMCFSTEDEDTVYYIRVDWDGNLLNSNNEIITADEDTSSAIIP